MTDRLNALTVVLEKDMREDDAKAVINAISQIRGVLSVIPNVTDMRDHIAQERARREIGVKLMEIVYPQLTTGS